MDGVIIDSEELHKKAYYETFKSLGLSVSPELYKSLTGASTINAFQSLVRHFGLSENPEDLVLQKRARYVQFFKKDPNLQLVAGVEEFIKLLHAKGKTLILASSSAMVNINRVFERFDLDRFFQAKISGAELAQSKPHPEIYEKALILSKKPKEECMVIEDSDNGIRAAKAAGLFVAGFKNPLSVDQNLREADVIVSRFSELLDYF